jgi:hypothetical protein
MSTPDAALIALGERFERRLLEYMDAWLAWAPLMRAARAEAESDLAGFAVAIQRNGCDAEQARMSELENDMQPLAEEIIAAPATSLGGLRAKALVTLCRRGRCRRALQWWDVGRHPSLSPAFCSWPPLRAQLRGRWSRAASRPFRRHFLRRQWLDRRAVNNGAVCVEHRSVTQAVPGALGIVPGHRTALVGAGCGKGMRLSVVILPHGELLLAALDDAAFARREVCNAGNTGG